MSIPVQIPLSDVLQTVSRPVVIDVMRELRTVMRISNDTEIRYYGDDGGAFQAGSSISLSKETATENRWPHVDNLTIEVSETSDPDQVHLQNAMRADAQPIFADNELGVYLWPAYSAKRVEIKIEYKAQDRNMAERWANEMRLRFVQGRDLLLHTVTYSYFVPSQLLRALQEIHTLRENVAPYGETFEHWIRTHFTERTTLTTNFAGKQKELTIAEQQAGVQGFFESAMEPDKPNKDNESGRWISTISYVFTYQQPVAVSMQYPLVVHQQIVPKEFRPSTPLNSFQEAFKQHSRANGSLVPFQARNQALMVSGNAGLIIPSFDNFVPRSVPMSTIRAAMCLSSISVSDRRNLLDLNKLASFRFHSDILEFLREVEWQYLAVPYASIIQLHLYRGVRIQEQVSMAVTDGLLVNLVADGDLRSTYRVRIGLVVDFDLLPQAAMDRLKRYPKAAIRLIKAINAAIRSLANHPDIGKPRLTPDDLKKIGLGYNNDWNVVPGDEATIPTKGNALIEVALIETLYVVAGSVAKQE